MSFRHESAHTFHIPVMGTGFSIDTPLHVARYGISSVISLVDDVLIEQMRKLHCERSGEPYSEISEKDDDSRARRITAYLDLMDLLVQRQVETLVSSPFDKGSDITRYYEMLPDNAPLKHLYRDMLAESDSERKYRMQSELRESAVPGSICVNIMTKVDRQICSNGKQPVPENSDAMSALRGYANSTLKSSIIFSAGINPRLYNYLKAFKDFFPGCDGTLAKEVALKVSDFRSAMIQGKYLAKLGIWVSEYRIESGLNCGGHAFPTDGCLLGPVMEEFRARRHELSDRLHQIYSKALLSNDRIAPEDPPGIRITVQGGIGTASENELLLNYYRVDGTGWGTPFLLVPEVTNIDEALLEEISKANEENVYLSDSSPFGVPFWNMRTSPSEKERRRRIADDKPGSSCPKGFLRFNTEFSNNPVCLASRTYLKHKLQQLAAKGLGRKNPPVMEENVLVKSCICHDLAGGATRKHGIDPASTPAVCCGPNIVHFSRIATLEEMVSHIYGRLSLLTNPDRPHMFIQEAMLYVSYLRREMEKYAQELSSRTPVYFQEFKENLLSGIEHYRSVAEQFIEDGKKRFLEELKSLQEEIEQLIPAANMEPCPEVNR